MTTDSTSDRDVPSDTILRSIAIFKFVEALALLLAGLAALKYLDPNVVQWVDDWTETLPLRVEQHVARHLFGWLSGLGHDRMKELGLGAFLLSFINSVEGVGLWLRQRWAEWLAVIATSLFIPLEILELAKSISGPKALVLVLNLFVVGYLIWRIRRDSHES